MRIHKLICLLMGLHIQHVSAQQNQLLFSTGLMVEKQTLQWSIAGNIQGLEPNILSELTFERITSLGSYANVSYQLLRYINAYASYRKGSIVSGMGLDADYKSDDRTNATFYETFLSDRGSRDNLFTGVNLCLFQTKIFCLDAGLSYSRTHQKLYILSSEIDELKSTYEARWKGVGLVVNGRLRIDKRISVTGSFACSLMYFHAQGNWNLRDEFMHPVSFEQAAKGDNFECILKLKYRLNSTLSVETKGVISKIRTAKGVDISYLQNSQQVATQFNGGDSKSCALGIGIYLSLCNQSKD